MATWPEIVHVKSENRYELILSGISVSKRLEKNGISDDLFSCSSLNFLRISDTCLNEVPSKIKALTNLTSLVLHSNRLTELCSEIGELTKLKLLDASNNQIQKIPITISKLEALVTLNLSYNKIEKIPDMSQNKWLSTVDFSCNLVEDMSSLCHTQLTHLSQLNFKGNKIKFIPPTIKELSALKVLDLSDNNISQVVGEIGDITKLKDLNLQGNPLADKRLAKVVLQCKSKQVLDYIREHCLKENCDELSSKSKKGKTKGKSKSNKEEKENLESKPSKYKIIVSKTDNMCKIKRTDFSLEVRPYILACVVKNVSLDIENMKKFIQLQTKMHDGICDKRNFATVATHDLTSCRGRLFTYTAVSPEALKIVPLSRNKEFSGKELFTQLQTEADNLRKEKKRSTYSGIHKFLHLLEGKVLYPCLLNCENVVISFPPLTNSELTKISINTTEILIEVTSSTSQSNCKKVLDLILKEMLLNGIGVIKNSNDIYFLYVEQVRIEEPDGNLIAVYPSRVDLQYEDDTVDVVRE